MPLHRAGKKVERGKDKGGVMGERQTELMVMDVPGGVQWWEEWQLRMLVLGSLVIQYILLVASYIRKFPIRSWYRPSIWLAYLGSDAIAIYALAALFNRHRKPHENGDGHGDSNSILEVLWAPILLIHLGGQDGITAYNIEDNELWMRHILTAVSQVSVAVYVFCKSWPGGDKNLLVAAILLFIPGILKCFEKPWALNRASINSLVSSSQPVQRSVHKQKLNIGPLEDFIDKAISPDGASGYLVTAATPVDFSPYELFVDLASPSPDDRVRMLLSFSRLDDNHAYYILQYWLSETFQLLYTKQKMIPDLHALADRSNPSSNTIEPNGAIFLRLIAMYLPFAAVGLFNHSHRETYSGVDVKVTYALLCCTAVLEVLSLFLSILRTSQPQLLNMEYNCMVSQYSLIGFLVRNRKHPKMMRIVEFLGLHQHWRMKSCSSSFSVTKLVLKYVKSGWEHHIRDVPSYRKFNDNRGQFTLGREGCYQELGWSLEGAFDESVLLWHLATDFCYYNTGVHHVYPCPAWSEGSDHHERAVQCREMSNYMMYLLFVNPEMLMAGTRRNLFTAACEEMKNIVERDKSLFVERELAGRIIDVLDGEGGSLPSDGAQQQQGGIICDAWSIAKVLSGLPQEKMWQVIEGVWVEMLCFSAARCRGYLHAKGLATGKEYLSCVWLLQYYMGMETLAAKLQRADHHHRNGGEHRDDPSTSRVRSSGATAQEKTADQRPYQGRDAIEEEMVRLHDDVT